MAVKIVLKLSKVAPVRERGLKYMLSNVRIF